MNKRENKLDWAEGKEDWAGLQPVWEVQEAGGGITGL